MRGIVLGVLLWAAIRTECRTQAIEVELERLGPVIKATLRADNVSVHGVLVRLASEAGHALKIAPEALPLLDEPVRRIHVSGMLLRHVVEHLAGVVGLDGVVANGVLMIGRGPPPKAEGAEAWLRARAQRAFHDVAATEGTPDDADRPLGWRLAMLHFAGGDFEEAFAGLKLFAEKSPLHPLAPRASFLAGFSAMQLGRITDAITVLEDFERRSHDVPEMVPVQLLLARCYSRNKIYAEAMVRLSRIIEASKDERSRALARVELAEMHFERGDAKEAVEALHAFDVDGRRNFPDLGNRYPFFLGTCLLAAGSARDAVPHLQLAALTDDHPLDRVRAAVGLVKAYFLLGDPTTALLAAECARRMEPTGAHSLVTLRLLAEVHSSIGLPMLASKDLEEILGKAEDGSPESIEALEKLAAIRFADRRFDGARECYARLAPLPAVSRRAQLGIVRCDMAAGEWKRALGLLESLTKETVSADESAELARLRGRCRLELGDYLGASFDFQGGGGTR